MRNRDHARRQVKRWIEAHLFMEWTYRLSDAVLLMRATLAQSGR